MVKHITDNFFRFTGNSWPCEKCSTLLTINVLRRLMVSLLAFSPIGFLLRWMEQFENPYAGFAVIAAIFILWSLLMFSFDTYTEIEKKEKE